jgi:hypothetical protein
MNRIKVYGPYKRTMAKNQTVYSETKSRAGKIGTTTARPASSSQRYPLDFAERADLVRCEGLAGRRTAGENEGGKVKEESGGKN